MTRRTMQAIVADDKRKHPEKFCPEPKCLWRTGGELCPRHGGPSLLQKWATGRPKS